MCNAARACRCASVATAAAGMQRPGAKDPLVCSSHRGGTVALERRLRRQPPKDHAVRQSLSRRNHRNATGRRLAARHMPAGRRRRPRRVDHVRRAQHLTHASQAAVEPTQSARLILRRIGGTAAPRPAARLRAPVAVRLVVVAPRVRAPCRGGMQHTTVSAMLHTLVHLSANGRSLSHGEGTSPLRVQTGRGSNPSGRYAAAESRARCRRRRATPSRLPLLAAPRAPPPTPPPQTGGVPCAARRGRLRTPRALLAPTRASACATRQAGAQSGARRSRRASSAAACARAARSASGGAPTARARGTRSGRARRRRPARQTAASRGKRANPRAP
eukprot:1514521-Prymnesium_polylepis.1